MAGAIVLENVTKTFGPKVAVSSLNLEIPIGGLYGFIGPNGAGKTSAIRLVMSILFPDSGQVSVLGEASALAAKDRIGYLPEERGLYRKMKVGAFLVYMGRLKGLDEGSLRGRVRGWLEKVGLADVEAKRCEELSKGMQQKVQFIAAVIHEPELLILRRAVHRAGSGQHAPFAGARFGTTRRRSNGVVLDARNGASGRDLRAHRHDPRRRKKCSMIVSRRCGRATTLTPSCWSR